MPTFNIVKKSVAQKTFRVSSIIGKYDLQSYNIEEKFIGNIDLPNNWNIGLIVGKSGTGKTTIAKELFPDVYFHENVYTNNSVIDDMPTNKNIDEIISAFSAVGFNSPPSWLKPYSALSNGEKMRIDLAKCILSEQELFLFDEYTSVVDRQVAKIGSYAIQKAIRKTQKKFIAVTCHHDVEDWLLPDWVFCTNDMSFHNYMGTEKKNRPELQCKIYKYSDKKIWNTFARYHYLSHTHNNSATVYICTIDNNIAGFCSVLHLPHPIVKNIKKVHRLVILPDYQGLGIGRILLEYLGKLYKNDGYRFTIVTSAPSLIYGLRKNNNWIMRHYGRMYAKTGILHGNNNKNNNSKHRITASFEYK